MAKESPKILFRVSQEIIPQTTPEATVPVFVVFSGKGPVDEQLVDLEGFETLYGKPDVLKYGVTSLYAYLFLQRTGGVAYVRRALHIEDVSAEKIATYAGALVRWIKDGVNDKTIEPLSEGIAVNKVESFEFPSSTDTRGIFKKSSALLFEAVTGSATIKVSGIDDLLKDAKEIAIMAQGTVPGDTTVTSTVLSKTDVIDRYNYVKLSAVAGAVYPVGSLVREVADDYYDGYIVKEGAYVLAQTVSGSVVNVNDGAKFKQGEEIYIALGNVAGTLVPHEILSISGNALTLDSNVLDGVTIISNSPVYNYTSATTSNYVQAIVPAPAEARPIPRVSVSASNTFDLPDTIAVVIGDVLYPTPASIISKTGNAVTGVVASGTAGYNKITVTSPVTLDGADDLVNACDIAIRRKGVSGSVLRPLISPVTNSNVLLREASVATSVNILVDDNDVINAGMKLLIDNGSTPNGAYSGAFHLVTDKSIVDNSYTIMNLEEAVTGTLVSGIYVKVNSSIKEKDAMLVIALTPGKYGNTVSVSIQDYVHPTRDDLFTITVIENGSTAEGPYICSRLPEAVDEYNNSQFVEDIINGTSRRIWIVDNPDAISPLDGVPYKPLYTDSMTLRPAPVANYLDMKNTVSEKVFSGDSVVKLLGQTPASLLGWTPGDKISLLGSNGTYYSYTVQSVVIDPLVTTLASVTIVGTFQESHVSGEKVYKLTGYTQGADIVISGDDITVDVGDSYTYNNSTYSVIDSGSNWFKKGQDGLLYQVADFLAGFEGFTNVTRFPEELLFSDGGMAQKEVFSGIAAFAKTRSRCMAYGSCADVSRTLTQGEYVNAKIAYADSTLTTDKYSTLFATYSRYQYGPNKFWLNDHLSNIINQYNYTLIQEGVLPAANNRGWIDGIVEKDIELDIELQDKLDKANLNYARKVGSGFTIISDNTRFNIDSFFQKKHLIHYINAVHSVVAGVFEPYLQEVVTKQDVENVDTAIGNLLTRQLSKMTDSYETASKFLSNGDGTNTWSYKLAVKPRDVTTKVIFDLTLKNGALAITVTAA